MKSGEVKLFLGILVMAVVLVGVSLALGKGVLPGQTPPPPPPPPSKNLTRQQLVPPGSRILGDPKAPFTLVEFGDYQCPKCADSVEKVGQILKKHGKKLNFVYHHFQAAQNHFHAGLLAQAAEAAAAQGKYWEMHIALFENQRKLDEKSAKEVIDTVMSIAGDLKLDMLKFRADLDSEATRRAVEASMRLGTQVGIQATPSFILVNPQGKGTAIKVTEDVVAYLDNPRNWK